MRRNEWTRDSVLKAILRREAAGLPLNHAAVLRQDSALHQAVLRIFRQWAVMLKAAGIDPARIREHRAWDRKTVVARLRARYAEGLPMNSRAIQLTEGTLYSAATRWFPSWEEALKAAGFTWRQCSRRCPNWTAETIIRRLREIEARGGRLNHTTYRRDSMSHAARVIFGSWDTALRAAGIEPALVRAWRPPWTKSALLDAIRKKHQAREPLNMRDARPHSLRRGANRLFGSWDRALRAAGLDPAKIKYHGAKGVWYGPRPPRKYGHRRKHH